MFRLGLLMLTVGVLACGGPSKVDGGTSTDAGQPADASVATDAGLVDAGAGPPDGGPVCASGAQCASGVCLPGGDCFNCQADAECGGFRRCGTGTCEAACTTAATCAPGHDCCGGRCVDPQRDPLHCGQCNQPCSVGQFCGRAQCREADFSALCQQPLATVVLDGVREDDDAGLSMAAALVAACAPTLATRTVGPDDAGVLGRVDGAPLQLGELLVVGGGSFRQVAVRWLEDNNQAQLRDTSTATDAIYSLRDGGVVSSVPLATLSTAHDRVLIQVARTASGALVLHAAGIYGPGTLAAASYFVQTIVPMRASLTTRWYVVEWQDVDASGGPSPADLYTLIASGR